MEIIVDGTNGGYRVFFHTSNAPKSLARDVRRIDAVEKNTPGQTAYAISFTEYGCAFTKYLIIRDQLRDYSIGNIAFTVCFLSGKRLSGRDIVDMLDKLSENYQQSYIGIDNVLGNVAENWGFINDISDKYNNRIRNFNDRGHFRPGSEEAAYIYYASNDELLAFFDSPFQTDFNKFKYVLFINQRLLNTLQDPLYVLRHNPIHNLTGKIDIFNTKYTLTGISEIQRRIGVTFKMLCNGQEILDNDSIRRNDQVDLIYARKYCKEFRAKGSLADLENKKLIRIDSATNSVSVLLEDIPLYPESKTIVIEFPFKGDKGVLVQKGTESERKDLISGDSVTFRGDEIGYRWRIISGNKSVGEIVPAEVRGDSFDVQESNSGKNQLYDGTYSNAHKSTYVDYSDSLATTRSSDKNTSHANLYKPTTAERQKRHFINNDKRLKVTIILLLLFISTFFIVWGISILKKRQEKEELERRAEDEKRQDVLQYCRGIELNRDTLNSYESSYCTSNKLDTLCSCIKDAIRIRDAINEREWDLLTSNDTSINYSRKQEFFRDSIKSFLDDNNLTDIDVSPFQHFDLNKILREIRKQISDTENSNVQNATSMLPEKNDSGPNHVNSETDKFVDLICADKENVSLPELSKFKDSKIKIKIYNLILNNEEKFKLIDQMTFVEFCQDKNLNNFFNRIKKELN